MFFGELMLTGKSPEARRIRVRMPDGTIRTRILPPIDHGEKWAGGSDRK